MAFINYQTFTIIDTSHNLQLIINEQYLVGMEYVECIQQYVSIILFGTPSTIQSMGSPKYCFDVTTRDAVRKTKTVAL